MGKTAVRALGLLGFLLGCGATEPLTLRIPDPLGAAVGRDLELPLHAYARGAVSWAWQSRTNPGLAERLRRPTLTEYTGGTAVWRWQPTADDLGDQEIAFTARADGQEATKALRFTVVEGALAPVFRAPYGEGTTHDLAVAPCVEVAILVESTGSPQVTLRLIDPPPNATLTQGAPLSGALRFCPTAAQFLAETIYLLQLQAEAQPFVVNKTYVIVLRKSA